MSWLGSAVVLLSAAASVAAVEAAAEDLYPAVFVLAASLGPNL